MTNTQIVIAELPSDSLTPAHFKQTTADMPVAGDGQVLLKVILMSIDAANRSWMKGATYRAAVNAGDAMPTYAICEVVESNSDRLAVGDIVAAEATWSNFVVADARKCEKLPKVPQLSNLMSVYGIAGKTAYHGLISVGQPVAGETVLVSAAAGSVGGYVGQIAKALGCRVVGIAGGAEKCKWVTEELGFDACIDYRAPGMSKALRARSGRGQTSADGRLYRDGLDPERRQSAARVTDLGRGGTDQGDRGHRRRIGKRATGADRPAGR